MGKIEMQEKIKPVLNGTAETMLQSFYARAEYSQRKKHKFYDAKAVELVNKIDYDFSTAAKDRTMSSGVIARTLVFDELVKEFIGRNPTATIVNIACGLDTRFYRVDNGTITWYNLDLPDVINLRDQIFLESGRVSSISASALDPNWFKEVKNRENVLFIIEGLSVESRSNLLFFVDIYLMDVYTVAILCRKLFEYGSYHFARTAPRGMEVYYGRLVAEILPFVLICLEISYFYQKFALGQRYDRDRKSVV